MEWGGGGHHQLQPHVGSLISVELCDVMQKKKIIFSAKL